MQGDAERCRPVALEHVAVYVNTDDVVGPKLLPQQQPWVAQERAVVLLVRDVPGQVIVVALAPQRAGQQDQLLAGREVGEQLLGCRVERHGSTFSGSGWR